MAPGEVSDESIIAKRSGTSAGCFCRFGAIDDALAAITIAKVRAHRPGQAEGHRADHQHSNRCESEWEYSWDLLNRLEENQDSLNEKMQDRGQRGRMRREIAND